MLIKQLFLYCSICSGSAYAQEHLYDYTFFINSRIAGDYFFSKASFESPSVIKNKNQRLPVSTTIFHTPGTALQLEYINGKKGNWKAAIFRENLRGQDHFKRPEYFAFSVYVVSGTTSKQLPSVQLIMKDSSFSARCNFVIHKNNSWGTILFPLSDFKGINFSDPADVIGVVFSQNSDDGHQHRIYIDDIEFLPAIHDSLVLAKPVLINASGYAKHVDISWNPVTDVQVKYIKIYRSEGET